ncbi:hypothetical protein BJY04DRAFT_227090 [Aspergillus karnatakaensis]|uniref:uncharacterized protein n=1 Tax=Aspergillus karnatakaensis TaxID=1810916 RepID=UPI003CCCCA3D
MSTRITETEPPISIAIIGSGIIGSVLALALATRSSSLPLPLRIKVYEQSLTHRTLGAGIAFTANARNCLSLLDPRLEDCVTAIASLNGEDPKHPNNNMQFVNGYTHDPVLHQNPGEDLVHKKVYRLFAGERGFEGCHRAGFLEGVLRILPQGVLEGGRRVIGLHSREGDGNGKGNGKGNGNGKVKILFEDGNTEEADIVIGCDGIKSRIRQHLSPPPSPCAHPHYTHKVAYRGLVPMPLAISTLGPRLALNQHMYGGPSAHILTFPVAKQTLLNIVAFVHDPDDWPIDVPMTQPADKEDVKRAFSSWGPTVKAIVQLLTDSEGLDKWGVFDMYDHPVNTYSKGRVCLAGDAAHASSPHHGAGAGIGVEDALALCVVLEKAVREISEGGGRGEEILEKALKVYSDVRYERSQWLVKSSREVCETYEWGNPEAGRDLDKGFEDVKERSHKIWYFDIQGMIEELERGVRCSMKQI